MNKNDTSNIKFIEHLKITDKKTQKVLLNKRGEKGDNNERKSKS